MSTRRLSWTATRSLNSHIVTQKLQAQKRIPAQLCDVNLGKFERSVPLGEYDAESSARHVEKDSSSAPDVSDVKKRAEAIGWRSEPKVADCALSFFTKPSSLRSGL
ncbi:hypothetical protein ISCGN_020125 [Ixodes scapularis]